ncbi:Arrestin-like protein [Armadillidium nasatum]|uniref:Arrestin-like protein n=1 Tax=Armadillidium nasatum TaxID=96803 RepID=A0A5N5SVZ3_9CRUS|nr:Arrestin-like protein [Armadillidium nasatum]
MVSNSSRLSKAFSRWEDLPFCWPERFIDNLTHVDPIDGVIVLETEDLGEQRVFVQLVLTYRYGREEDEVMGLTFAKEIIVTSQQIYPKLDKGSEDSSENDEVTSLQVCQ